MNKIRALVDAAKNVKDIVPNIREMKNSEKKLDLDILRKLQHFTAGKLDELEEYYKIPEQQKALPYWQMEIESFYQELISYLYGQVEKKVPHGAMVSTMTNAIKKNISSLESLAVFVTEKNSMTNIFEEVTQK